MRTFTALLAVLVVPLIGLAIGTAPYYSDFGVTNPLVIGEAVAACLTSSGSDRDFLFFCSELTEFHLLAGVSFVTAALGLAMMIFAIVMAKAFGRTRGGLAFSFRTVTLVALFATALITAGQAVIIVGSLYLGMSYFFGIIIPYLLIAAGIGGIALTFIVFGSLPQMFKKARTSTVALELEPDEGAELRDMVKDVATELDTRVPDNIVYGLEPNFFATSALVSTPFSKTELKGETLYVSLPLMRVLSTDETRAIIGHELGHFTGGDTIYSKKFGPAYASLNHARYNLATQDHVALQIGAIPVMVILNFIVGLYEPSEKRISREREYRADEIGASVSSPDALSSALVKLSTFFQIWQAEEQDATARIMAGRGTRNLSRNFVDRGQYDTDLSMMGDLTTKSLDEEIEHPIDTHPPTGKRIEAMGINPQALVAPQAFIDSLFPEDTLASRGAGMEALEEKMTEAYQQLVVHYRGIDQREEVKMLNAFANLLSMFLAKMVTIDGHVDEAEIQTAQLQSREYDPSFDATSFREYCRHPEDIPETDKLIEWGNQMLTTEGAARLKEVLQKIAEADGIIQQEEADLMARLAAELVGDDVQPEPQPEPAAEKRSRRRGRR